MAMTEARTVQSAYRVNERPSFETIEEERLHRKQQLVGAFRVFADMGFDEGRQGHLTARDPEHTDCFWMNPRSVPFSRMTVSDLHLVHIDGEIVEGDDSINPAGYVIHSRVLKENPSIVSAAHAHTVHGMAWSALGRKLDPITQDSCFFYGSHAVLNEYSGVVLDMSEGMAIAELVRDNKLVILQNHGLLTAGRSVEEAAWFFIAAETCCRVQLLAESVGAPIQIDHEVAAPMGNRPTYGGASFKAHYLRALDAHPEMLD